MYGITPIHLHVSSLWMEESLHLPCLSYTPMNVSTLSGLGIDGQKDGLGLRVRSVP